MSGFLLVEWLQGTNHPLFPRVRIISSWKPPTEEATILIRNYYFSLFSFISTFLSQDFLLPGYKLWWLKLNFSVVKKCNFHLLSEFGPRGQQWRRRGVNFSNFIPGGWWGHQWWGHRGPASIDIEDLMIYCNAFLDALASLRPMMEIY